MRKTMKVFAALLLSATAPFEFAQRGAISPYALTQRGGIHSFGHAGHDSAAADSRQNPALRATDTQREAFAHCMAATGAARETGWSVGDKTYWNSWRYRHLGYDLDAVYSKKDQLRSTLADMTAAHQQFLQILSPEQATELKPNLSKLERLQGDLNLQLAQLNEALTATKPDSFRVSTRLYGIGKTIDKWRSQHRKIAKEMGIPR